MRDARHQTRLCEVVGGFVLRPRPVCASSFRQRAPGRRANHRQVRGGVWRRREGLVGREGREDEQGGVDVVCHPLRHPRRVGPPRPRAQQPLDHARGYAGELLHVASAGPLLCEAAAGRQEVLLGGTCCGVAGHVAGVPDVQKRDLRDGWGGAALDESVGMAREPPHDVRERSEGITKEELEVPTGPHGAGGGEVGGRGHGGHAGEQARLRQGARNDGERRGHVPVALAKHAQEVALKANPCLRAGVAQG